MNIKIYSLNKYAYFSEFSNQEKMTNHLNEPKTYARLPTFVEVIDILVAGFGIDANKENALRNLGMFEYRVRGVVAQMPVAAEVGSGDERDELGSG